MYSEYDLQCMFYLGLEIRKMLLLEENFMWIDLYFEKKIKEIYSDYKKKDYKNKSLLDSIHTFVNKNEEKIMEQIKYCFD